MLKILLMLTTKALLVTCCRISGTNIVLKALPFLFYRCVVQSTLPVLRYCANVLWVRSSPAWREFLIHHELAHTVDAVLSAVLILILWDCLTLTCIVTVVLVVTLLFRPLYKFMFTYLLTLCVHNYPQLSSRQLFCGHFRLELFGWDRTVSMELDKVHY